jgi:hypothetical protein
MMPAPSTRSDYDVIFLETGFKNMDTVRRCAGAWWCAMGD